MSCHPFYSSWLALLSPETPRCPSTTHLTPSGPPPPTPSPELCEVNAKGPPRHPALQRNRPSFTIHPIAGRPCKCPYRSRPCRVGGGGSSRPKVESKSLVALVPALVPESTGFITSPDASRCVAQSSSWSKLFCFLGPFRKGPSTSTRGPLGIFNAVNCVMYKWVFGVR